MGRSKKAVPNEVRVKVVAHDAFGVVDRAGSVTAQEMLKDGTNLASDGATGGVTSLSTQTFSFGTNDTLQGDLTISPTGAVTVNNVPFNPVVFTLFNAWYEHRDEAHAAIERGQALFNAPRLSIRGVGGLNDASITLPDGSTVTGPTALRGSCSTCHNAPNVGDHATRLPINIGVSDKSPERLGRGAVAGLPYSSSDENPTAPWRSRRIQAARSSQDDSHTSGSSKVRSCAGWPRGRRSSTTAWP